MSNRKLLKSDFINNGFWQGNYTTIWYHDCLPYGVTTEQDSDDDFIDILGELVANVKTFDDLWYICKDFGFYIIDELDDM